MNKKPLRITSWAFVLAAFCMTGCSDNKTSEYSVRENNSAVSSKEAADKETETTETDNADTPETSAVTESENKADTDTEKADSSEDVKSAETKSGDVFTERDLCLTPDISDAVTIEAKDNSDYTVSSEGIYLLTGTAENFTVTVDADKKDKVQIVLKNAEISNDDFPVIYVKSADKCFISPEDENTLTVTGEFRTDGDNKTDAVIWAKDDVVLNGTGTLNIGSMYGNGISVKDDFKATGGIYNINCALDGIEVNDSVSVCGGEFRIQSDKDAVHCENSDDNTLGSVYIEGGIFRISAKSDGIQATSSMIIDGGTFEIESAEGLESTYIQINGGDISIQASDDGINAAAKSTAYDVLIEFNGGNTTIVMGAGDTDGIDANGSIIVNGGTINVTGNSTFDYDVSAQYNGGIIIVNGTQVDEIPQSMMGGHGGFGGGQQGGFDRRMK